MGVAMKQMIAIALAGMVALPIGFAGRASAEPGGCLKYGAAGAVGGHLAGHGIAGAAAGCATGMAVRHHSRQRAREQMYQQDNGTLQRGTAPGATAAAPYNDSNTR